MRKGNPVAAALLVGGLGDRALDLGPRVGFGFGFGSRFQLDRGAQLVDRRYRCQLRVMLIRTLTAAGGDAVEDITSSLQPGMTNFGRLSTPGCEPSSSAKRYSLIGRQPLRMQPSTRRPRPDHASKAVFTVRTLATRAARPPNVV